MGVSIVINLTLYKREMKNSLKMLIIFAAIISMYVAIIISMYDPDMMASLEKFNEAMPELMDAVGMKSGATTLIGFMISYLYGFILLVFPMIFCILRGNGVIAKYVDKGSMVILLAAPIKRSKVALTQIFAMVSGIVILISYTTVLEIVISNASFSKELVVSQLLKVNIALLCLHLFIGSICYLSSCIFSEMKYSIAFGAGIPALMFILQMLANAGEKAKVLKYFTFFTLYDANGIVEGNNSAIVGAVVLAIGAVFVYLFGIFIFNKKDLHI